VPTLCPLMSPLCGDPLPYPRKFRVAGDTDGVTLKAIMCQRFSVAFVLVLTAVSPLLAQHPSLSFCLAQTKPDAWTQYDPPAGPWAIELYTLLSARKLRSGAPLRITVLAALGEVDVLPEVRRLQCPYVVQLRYHRSITHGGRSPGEDEDSVLFSLWNGATGEVIANGASLIPGRNRLPSTSLPAVCADLTQQIMKGLNKLP
jgi:hypothetical protein